MVATGRKWAMMHGNMDFEFQKENVAFFETANGGRYLAGVAPKAEQCVSR
jgi:hypothetical protein